MGRLAAQINWTYPRWFIIGCQHSLYHGCPFNHYHWGRSIKRRIVIIHWISAKRDPSVNIVATVHCASHIIIMNTFIVKPKSSQWQWLRLAREEVPQAVQIFSNDDATAFHLKHPFVLNSMMWNLVMIMIHIKYRKKVGAAFMCGHGTHRWRKHKKVLKTGPVAA